jgi:KaiC/GvpD/RAD55 family RecA-like ATPase
MSHNVVVLRTVDHDGQFDRTLAILKMRDSDYDRSAREVTITDRGIVLAPRVGTSRSRAAGRRHRKSPKPRIW